MVGTMKVTKQVRYNVERFYYDNYRVTETEKVDVVRGETNAYPQGEHGMKLYQHKDDEGNFIYTTQSIMTKMQSIKSILLVVVGLMVGT